MTATRPTIIAEAGVNHNGDLGRALALVDAAADAGADIVKFQAFRAGDLVAKSTATPRYQKTQTGETDQASLLRKLELPLDAFATIADRCKQCGIGFLCTAFDVDAIETLIGYGMPAIKVASGELTNLPALARFSGYGLPLLLSTGMADMQDISTAVQTCRNAGATEITLLQCTSLYPAPASFLNLNAITTLRQTFNIPVGFSDHSLGDHAAIAATALGATVIEKHFTLDRQLPGPDHAASLEPDELAAMIRKLADIAAALGDGHKVPSREELDVAALVRRSWHATADLPAGHVLTATDMTLKRPATGLPPGSTPVGRQLRTARRVDDPIRQDDLTDA
jgi:N,N'-diacetyllegionaminate synthase